MSEERKHYIYLHLKDNDFYEVFYVGLGSSFKRYKSSSGRSQIWKNYTNKHGLQYKIVSSNLTLEEATELEKFFIKEFGRMDQGLGPLINLTAGGEGRLGTKGYKLSEETKHKMSVSKKGRPNLKLVGRKQDPEFVKCRLATRKSNGLLGREQSPEHIKKSADSRRGIPNKYWIGRKHTPETLEKMKKSRALVPNTAFVGKKHKKETIELMCSKTMTESQKIKSIFSKLISGHIKKSKYLENMLGTFMYIKELCANSISVVNTTLIN